MKHFIIMISVFALATAYAQTSQVKSVRPKEGFVPDTETAVKVAEAVLIPVYGEKRIHDERPFKAKLSGDVWTLEGTVPCNTLGIPCPGGAAVVRVSKTSGQILFMMHYQ